MEVWFYMTRSGGQPVRDYIEALPKVEAAPILAGIRAIAAHGLPGMPNTKGLAPAAVDVKPLSGKLWEWRADAHRVFYFLAVGRRMVLLHAYKKEGQKAPRIEIEVARSRMDDFHEQNRTR